MTINRFTRFCGFLGTILCVFTGCTALDASYASGNWKRNPHVYLEKSPKDTLLNGKSAMVFYRPQSVVSNKPVNIYVDKNYVASLLPAGFTVVQGCTGEIFISVGFNDVANHYSTKFQSGIPVNLQANQVKYFEVDTADRARITEVNQVNASEIKQQVHTIQRLGSMDCGRGIDKSSSDTVVAPIVAENINKPIVNNVSSVDRALSPDQHAPFVAPQSELRTFSAVNFAFAQSSKASLTTESHVLLKELVAQLSSDFARVNQISLYGYTDAVDTHYKNILLSRQRVNTVKNYLQELGVKGVLVKTHSFGKLHPIADCRRFMHSDYPQRQQCNLANRRVEISIVGLSK